MKLKQKVDPEKEFLIDLRKVGSPAKKTKKEKIDREQDLQPGSSIHKRLES
jgi:hypothetical protein